MIENLILQFGALGIVAYVVYFQTTVLKEVIENNTRALLKVEDNILNCKKK
jgi:hypothetical protein